MKIIINNKEHDIEKIKTATLQFQVECGAFFKKKRLRQNKSEEDIAGLLNVSVQTIRDYESGKKGIPLFRVYALSEYLKIHEDEIGQLHHDLEKKLLPPPLFKQQFVEVEDIGKIIHRARKTVFLTTEELAQLLTQSGCRISESEIARYENGDKKPSVKFWIKFCELIHLGPEAVAGYSRWAHLALISVALEKNEVCFPVTSKLLNALENYRSASEANQFKLSYLMRFSVALWRRLGRKG